MTRVTVGVGLSSKATATEVAELVDATLREHGLARADVDVVATRDCFAADERLALGLPVVGFDDDTLVVASEPTERTVGIPARVAETAARLAAGSRLGDRDDILIAATARSAHVTIALALAPPAGGRARQLEPLASAVPIDQLGVDPWAEPPSQHGTPR